jgi:hypothetical protein
MTLESVTDVTLAGDHPDAPSQPILRDGRALRFVRIEVWRFP